MWLDSEDGEDDELCINVLRTWVVRFKRSICSLGTTCHTISWFTYLLFAHDVCVCGE